MNYSRKTVVAAKEVKIDITTSSKMPALRCLCLLGSPFASQACHLCDALHNALLVRHTLSLCNMRALATSIVPPKKSSTMYLSKTNSSLPNLVLPARHLFHPRRDRAPQ